MKKFNAKRRKSAQKNAQKRWEGSHKILQLLARANHSLEVEPVVYNHYAVDLLVNRYGL